MISRHAALLSKITMLVSDNQNKLVSFRSAIRQYKNNESGSKDLIDTVFNVLDRDVQATVGVVRDVAGLFDSPGEADKNRSLLEALNGFKVEVSLKSSYLYLADSVSKPAATRSVPRSGECPGWPRIKLRRHHLWRYSQRETIHTYRSERSRLAVCVGPGRSCSGESPDESTSSNDRTRGTCRSRRSTRFCLLVSDPGHGPWKCRTIKSVECASLHTVVYRRSGIHLPRPAGPHRPHHPERQLPHRTCSYSSATETAKQRERRCLSFITT